MVCSQDSTSTFSVTYHLHAQIARLYPPGEGLRLEAEEQLAPESEA